MKRILKRLSVILLVILNIQTLVLGQEDKIVENKIVLDAKQNVSDITPFKASHRILSNVQPDSPLTVNSNDIFWEFSKSGDYIDLVIRKKKYIGSIMLTNMYYGDKYVEQYGRKVYGLRTKSFNRVNGNEVRIVKKKVIGKKQSLFFLVDSKPERHPIFGYAFRIRIPRLVEYGYKAPGENYGIISIESGITLNLRSYVRRYADHRGKYQNNPVHIDFTKESYYERIKPVVTKIDEFDEGNYRVIKIKYFSRVDYVNYFLVRDFHQGKMFKKISFVSRQKKRHKTAVVVRAIRKPRIGITIVALIYLKKGDSEKDYNISAMDQANRIAKNFISVTVPQSTKRKKAQPIDPKEKEPSETIIFDEKENGKNGDFFNDAE